MKLALVCSHGGHLTELQMLRPALEGHEWVLISYRCRRTEELPFEGPKYLLDNIGTNLARMIAAFARAARILLRERPDVILSTGAEIAIPFLWTGKLLGIKTIYVETWCRVQTRSGTGRLVYRAADLFLVQWPELIELYGRRARHEGGLL